MSRIGDLVIAIVNPTRGHAVISAGRVQDLMVTAGAKYRTLPSGAVIIDLAALGDIEAACTVMHRPLRIQHKRVKP